MTKQTKIKRLDGKIHIVKKWDYIKKDVMYCDMDANDFYYQWVELKSDDSLVELFDRWLDVGYDEVKVIIKARKGGIYFEAIKDKSKK